MAVRLGRVELDDRGVRGKPLLGLFGSAWSVSLDAITAWRTLDELLISRREPEGAVIGRVLEIEHAEGTQVVRWGRAQATFDAFVAELDRLAPGKRREHVVREHRSNEKIPL